MKTVVLAASDNQHTFQAVVPDDFVVPPLPAGALPPTATASAGASGAGDIGLPGQPNSGSGATPPPADSPVNIPQTPGSSTPPSATPDQNPFLPANTPTSAASNAAGPGLPSLPTSSLFADDPFVLPTAPQMRSPISDSAPSQEAATGSSNSDSVGSPYTPIVLSPSAGAGASFAPAFLPDDPPLLYGPSSVALPGQLPPPLDGGAFVPITYIDVGGSSDPFMSGWLWSEWNLGLEQSAADWFVI